MAVIAMKSLSSYESTKKKPRKYSNSWTAKMPQLAPIKKSKILKLQLPTSVGSEASKKLIDVARTHCQQ